ncbi:1-acyl-sn-glycerol-3-phosphate acyltransferase [Mycobacterium botniense]|uniref:1-acyl-sn-glycerol-3-phosphate acyltransferase n=1 Tax=Mycobacterium botniense TaxID=84962 RepID=A0A7I9XRV6_9MYCO|nr:1-acyl-sn-glycerol-3-phosphate acyltransferase [Mycobacterium botniense]
MEPVYATIIQLARLTWRVQGLQFHVTGVENVPASGGAVIAINHTSYFDFTFAGLPAYQQGLGRKVRFMAKREVFDHKVAGPIMRACRHIPVDRDNGAAAFDAAVVLLKAGELVGVYPEATISRSFEIKELKGGAARMAVAADVPIIPHRVGAQRIWTKDHPKKLFRPKVPIAVAVGEPIAPTLPASELTALLRARMQHLLEGAGGLRAAPGRGVLGAAPAGGRRAVIGGGSPTRRPGGCRRAARRAEQGGAAGAVE